MKFLKKIKSEVSLTVENECNEPYDNADMHSFHKHIRFAVLIAQFFGVMPLHGIRAPKISDVRFKWFSLRFVYTVYHLLASSVTVCFCIAKFAIFGFEVDKTGPLIFYISCSLASLQFIQIARNWPKILHEWSAIDRSMKYYPQQQNLHKKCILLTIVLMGAALVEHLLFLLNAFKESQLCASFEQQPLATYFHVVYPHYFYIIPYSHGAAAYSQITNFLSTFTWNFFDLFIMLVCVMITEKFRQITKRIKETRTHTMDDKFWKMTREDYNRLVQLVAKVDEFLSPLVLISYTDNVLFLCTQLYNSLKERVGLVESIYFFYSFFFMVSRTVFVSLYGAWLHEETKKPLEILHAIPSEDYSDEVKRFTQQINSSAIGITGYKFFMVTRNFLLQAAGTIITIELMYFQFAPIKKYDTKTYNCL